MDDKKNLLLLFQHPADPTFLPKNGGSTVIDVPTEYLTDRYKPIGAEINTRFGDDVDNHVPIRSVALPDLTFTAPIRRQDGFSLFITTHRTIAGKLIKLFMDQPDVPTLMSVATYARDRVNKYLYQYALAVAINHRSDTKDVDVPSIVQIFPEKFMDSSVFPTLREEATVVNPVNRMVVEIPRNYTASNRETEQRMAYFREDIGINLHHWHWHLVYPGSGEERVVRKDRRGELFYYMHSQIQARYNVARFCERMPRVKSWNDFREVIAEAYFPKIIRSSNNRTYPPRSANTRIADVNRTDNGTIISINELEGMRDRVLRAIDQGFIERPSGERIPLDEFKGIDYLGDIVEASTIAINPQLYGNLHNEGHNVIAYCHDPENRYLEDFAVIGDVTTAMRDPAFYKWHGYLDDIFERHKEKLPSYTAPRLQYDGIVVNKMDIQLSRANSKPGTLLTYWQKTSVDLAAGLDFGPEGNILASFTHLQHAPYTYRISVTNGGSAVRRGTCRIFLGPTQDDRGQPLAFREQRGLMIELDKFAVNLNPGENTIVRRSDQSSITIPYERTFRAVGTAAQPTNPTELDRFRFCGCGWPQHMLLPKGTTAGLKYQTFVMISNYTDDFVAEFDQQADCSEAHSFCGLRDRLYPDKRSMGYPFDRVSSANSLLDFTKPYANMKTGEVLIKFTDTYIART